MTTWVRKQLEDGSFSAPQPCVDLAYAACLGYVECDPPSESGAPVPAAEVVAPRKRREKEAASV